MDTGNSTNPENFAVEILRARWEELRAACAKVPEPRFVVARTELAGGMSHLADAIAILQRAAPLASRARTSAQGRGPRALGTTHLAPVPTGRADGAASTAPRKRGRPRKQVDETALPNFLPLDSPALADDGDDSAVAHG
jgi:hypothetical protein